MKLFDGIAAHTYVVRLFILERKGGLAMDVQQVDVLQWEQRRLSYRQNVNSRGEVPALLLDDGTFLTEVIAICEYLDEIAVKGSSLLGSSPIERAQTRMRLRQVDLEIVQPTLSWWRNDPNKSIALYRGSRVPHPEAQLSDKIRACQSLNRLDDELQGKDYLCGNRISMADIYLYGILKMMTFDSADWIVDAARSNVAAYFDRMDKRQASKESLSTFPARVEC